MKGRMRPPAEDYTSQADTVPKPQSKLSNSTKPNHDEWKNRQIPRPSPQQNSTTSNDSKQTYNMYSQPNKREEEVHTTSQAHKTKENEYKINPRLIPRPNHFDEIYRNNEQTPIYETTEDVHPPHSSTYYSVKETQNSSCRFIRSSLTKIPNDQSTLNGTSLIFGLYMQPFCELPDHEAEVPKVEVGDQILRCRRCNAYINSKFQITYSRQNKPIAICNLCSCDNELDTTKSSVKAEYLSSNFSGAPELLYPTVDFKAPANLRHTNPFIPHYIFLIDISSLSFDLGLPSYVLNSISANLDFIHFGSNSYITIATYDFKSIHFFYIDKGSDVKSYIVTDINNPFCPMPISKLFLNVSSQKSEIEKLIERITVFINERNKEGKKGPPGSCTGSAINAGVDALLENGGRVIVFTCSSCVSGFGACKPKEDNKLFNTENEKALYLPQHTLFASLAETCNEKRIVVDQFIMANPLFDLATFSLISNLTGGTVQFYPANLKDMSGLKSFFEKMHYDLSRILTRPNYYDVKFMLRFSLGIESVEILGPFSKKLGDGFSIAGCDPDYSFAYHLRLSESFQNDQRVHFQLVCLYINNFNERYLRIFNYTIISTNDISKIFWSTDVDTLSKVTILKEISLIHQTEIATARKNLHNRIIESFKFYRTNCSKDSPSVQLILPASIKYYPLYLNAFIKKPILRVNKVGISSNYITHLINKFSREPIYSSMKFLYPKFFRIDDIQADQSKKFKDAEQDLVIENVGLTNERYNIIQKPFLLPLSSDFIDFDCAYLTDDGEFITLFVFNSIKRSFYQELFNASSWDEAVGMNIEGLDENNTNDLSLRILNIIGQLRKDNNGVIQPLKVSFLDERGYLKPELATMMIEDKSKDEVNYPDFLSQLHEEIQKRMK